ncbi:MAG: hypothetical protein ACRCYO_02660, partial [Bacteroidia bacterium]
MRIVILGASSASGRALFRAFAAQNSSPEILATVGSRDLHFEGVTGLKHQRSLVFDPLVDDWRIFGKVDVLINCIHAGKEMAEKNLRTPELLIKKIIEKRAALNNPRIIQVSVSGANEKA